jgi:hypothetical protein
MAEWHPRKRQNSAILARALQIGRGQLLEPIGRAVDQAENAKSFAASGEEETLAARLDDAGRSTSAISIRQNIRIPASARGCGGAQIHRFQLEPRWNCSGTSNLLIHNREREWFQSSSVFLTHIRARLRTLAHAHMTRGQGAEPLEPEERCNDINDLTVPCTVPSWFRLEPLP